MRWRRGVGSDQIEDRRGMGAPAIGGGLGIVGVLVVLVMNLLGGGGGGGGIGLDPFPAMPAQRTGGELESAQKSDVEEFVGFVVDHVQDSWQVQFEQANRTYEPTTLVLFEQAVSTGCGSASSATGPFYCPADRRVYLDLGFFRELRSRFGAPGDFAQAYVIAHEFGHHVQNVLGINTEVQEAQRSKPDDANDLSVKLELQADCLAGVWAHAAKADELLEAGDVQEGLDAAAAVGDDRLQRQAGGRVNPESWTHGSSEQRMEWFSKGFESGDVNECDTFG